jgi:sulfite reductase alpha subunit
MIAHPRTSSYVRLDDWDQEAQKWVDRKKSAAAQA